jgi:hypothetical protein
MEQKVIKEYVSVVVQIKTDGTLVPLSVILDDGREYEIDDLMDACKGVSLKAGGCGMRYTIRIRSHVTYLYNEANRWFVERRVDQLLN